jgi:hypothetical protein
MEHVMSDIRGKSGKLDAVTKGVIIDQLGIQPRQFREKRGHRIGFPMLEMKPECDLSPLISDMGLFRLIL